MRHFETIFFLQILLKLPERTLRRRKAETFQPCLLASCHKQRCKSQDSTQNGRKRFANRQSQRRKEETGLKMAGFNAESKKTGGKRPDSIHPATFRAESPNQQDLPGK
jgi:hypothetical protein